MHTVLLDRAGYVIQKWNDTHISSLDPRAYAGRLLQVEGDVAPGHQLKDGRFYMVPPRIEADEIRAEMDRRLGVFPPALQKQLAALGGEFTIQMFEYVRDVQMQATVFLAMDSAPADYADDKHWPALPDLTPSPVALAPPQPMTVHNVQPSVPVEVRVVLETPSAAATPSAAGLSLPTRVVEHVPATQIVTTGEERLEPVSPVDSPEDLEAAKQAYILAAERAYDEHKDTLLTEERRQRLMDFALEATVATTVAEIQDVSRRTIQFIEGAA